MASRAQRRAQRRAQGAAAPAGAPAPAGGGDQSFSQRARSRQAQVRPAAAPAKTQTGSRKREDRGSKRFVAESWGELRKVEWPTQSHVMQGTLVVIIACIIVGAYLYAADQVFKPFVRTVLLGE